MTSARGDTGLVIVADAHHHLFVGCVDGMAQALGLLRERRRLSYGKLPKLMGYADPSSVMSLEKGNPSVENLGRFLDALGVTVRDLADALDEVNGRATVRPPAEHEALAEGAGRVAADLLRELERANNSRLIADLSERIERLERRLTTPDSR